MRAQNQNIAGTRPAAGAGSLAQNGQPRVDPDIFRAVMRQLAGGVTVITTVDEGKPHGFTATAFCSVCAEPPTVLIVVNRTARTHPHIDARRHFAVNLLADSQTDLANRFAGKMENQFDGMSYTIPEDGAPVFDGVAAQLQCIVSSRLDVGTHTIFIGDVVGGGTSESGPLVYHSARFGRIEQID
ncbi:FMN reductase (NADH) NtaB [Methyloligella halotolerans]|uniref:FMN reductase (NADH) NtaB n=1 Tax=Methyloligella halotolerans TaxID=1177755 RepID=A0A1E2RZV3_9HYPH|nr:flavin reductase family protein [Methyloligella halotolerans]ODA67741.1 FMN reductase (NADH) NtaB [Methyloligella halotolerans]